MKNARLIYLLYSFASSMLFQLAFTTSMLYFINDARLDPLQLVLVGTALEGSIFLFEIPTGVVADLYSRRLSIIIGLFLLGAGFILEGAVPLFASILISQLLWGIGYTFTSGASQAWISDEIGEENSGPVFMRAAQLEQLGGLLGIGAGILLGNITLPLPIITAGVLFALLGGILILVMPETGFHPTPAADRSTFQKMAGTLRRGAGMVRLRPALAGILAIGLLFGIYSEGYDRLWTNFMLERFTFPAWAGMTTVTWFGLIDAAGMLLTAAASEVLQRRVDLQNTRRVARAMAACTLVLVAALFLFPLSYALPAAIALVLVIAVTRSLNYPLYTTWVNHRLDPQVRATVISMSSQVDALGQIGGGPVVGLIARARGTAAGLLTSAAMLAPVLLLFAPVVRGDNQPEITGSDL